MCVAAGVAESARAHGHSCVAHLPAPPSAGVLSVWGGAAMPQPPLHQHWQVVAAEPHMSSQWQPN